MDAKVVKMISKGLQAYKRKGIMDEPSKRTKMGAPSSAVPTNVAPAIEAAVVVEVTPAIGVDATTKAAGPSMPSNPSIKVQAPEPPLEKEKEVEKKKTRRTLRKSQWKTRCNGPNDSDEESGKNPFNNHEIVRGLVDRFTILKVVDRIIDADIDQDAWDSLGSFFEITKLLKVKVGEGPRGSSSRSLSPSGGESYRD
ncbi:hypothetical protein COCNU_scaffold001459G000110 [Cocos nucifera]|nr:hypothetical protein [Cocos nucifera]